MHKDTRLGIMTNCLNGQTVSTIFNFNSIIQGDFGMVSYLVILSMVKMHSLLFQPMGGAPLTLNNNIY